MSAMTDDEALERKVHKAERDRQKLQEYNRKTAVEALYKTTAGRSYLRWLLEMTGAIGHNPYRGDPNATAFQCGVLSVGQTLMAHMVETDPTQFVNLLKELDNATRNSSEPDNDDPDLFDGPEEPTPAEPVYYS